MNKQEIFDKIVEHASLQRCKSLSKNEKTCLYRASDGRKCFIGALIPDEIYAPEMENQGVCELTRNFPIIHKLFGFDLDSESQDEDMRFLYRLQNIHDSYEPHRWPEELVIFAGMHKLTIKGIHRDDEGVFQFTNPPHTP